MNKIIFYKAAFVSFCLCFVLMANAQQGVVAAAAIDKNRIVIGEHIQLTLSVDVPENEAIRFFSIDSIPHFEFLEKQGIDTSNTTSGTRLTQIIRLTSFDSGSWVIPAFVLAGNIITDSIPVEVSFSSFDPNQPYHDIKDVIDVEEEEKKEWWGYAVAGGLLLLVILYLLLRKKKKPVIKAVEAPVDPYREAMTQLEGLQKQKPEVKQYYSSLVDIFRLYVYRRKGVLSLQKTTDDLVLQLKNINIPKEQFDRLAQALRLSDFVKFAKFQPGDNDDRESLESIKQVINLIEQTHSAPQQVTQ